MGIIPTAHSPAAAVTRRRRRGGRVLRWLGICLAVAAVVLVLIGQAIFLVRAIGISFQQSQDVPRTRHGTPAQKLHAVLASALGPSDRGVRRFSLDLRQDPHDRAAQIAYVTWSINNDIGSGTVGNGAQLDAYAIARAVYTSGLPVRVVKLTGTYPLHGPQEGPVMRLSLDRRAALAVGRDGWQTLDPTGLWPLFHHAYVAPAFEPSSGE